MKTNYCALFLVVSLSGLAYAQNSPTPVKASEMKDKARPQQVKIERDNGPVQLIDTVAAEEIHHGQVQYFEVSNQKGKVQAPRTIEVVERDIKNIQDKIDVVNANEEMRKKALASGWFNIANARLTELQSEKQKLENK
jgi:hypothetical protein